MMEKTIIKHARIIDLTKDNSSQENDLLINEKGMIEEIAPTINVESKTNVIDLKGQFVIPGLINAHAHLFSSGKPMNLKISPSVVKWVYRLGKTSLGHKIIFNIMKKNAKIELDSGVTTVRTVGEFFYQDVKLRDRINLKQIVGPTLFVSGFFLSITDGHGAPYLALESDSPWEGRKNVRKNTKQGVDWIKICVTGGVTDAKRVGEAGALQLTLEEVTAICEEAHKNNVMVAAHVESTEGVRIALKGGVDTIEHGAFMDQEIIDLYKNNPNALRGFTTLIPTFAAAVPSKFLSQEETGLSDLFRANGIEVCQDMIESFQQAVQHDIQIGVGNDASMTYVTHYDFWREIAYQAKFGPLSDRQALELATLKNAQILGIEELYGSLEVGKMADFLVLKEDPTKNLRTLAQVEEVFKHGERVENRTIKKYQELDKLLDKILA